MPHGNRVSGSSALKTNDIWSKTIGYDPYANSNESKNDADVEAQRASLMLLARMSNLSGSESRGGCKKCGLLGHLSFQCRNAPLKKDGAANEADSDSDSSSSSEEEVVVATKKKEREHKEDGRKRARSDSSSSSSSSDDSSREKKKRKHKKHKKSSKEHSKKEHKKKSKKEKKEKK
eukprot:gene33825-40927_t